MVSASAARLSLAPMLLFVQDCLAEGAGFKDWPPTNPNPHRADPPSDTYSRSL